jgi:hypothetical protein
VLVFDSGRLRVTSRTDGLKIAKSLLYLHSHAVDGDDGFGSQGQGCHQQ